MTAADAALSASAIGRNFGATRAPIDTDQILRRGEVVALMGASGAGKSTRPFT